MPYAAENSTANSHIHNSRGERGRSFHTTSKKISNQKKKQLHRSERCSRSMES